MSNFHNNPNLLLNNMSHPIIKQKNTFSLHKKLLSVHANDREQFFYNNNNFSIKTPQAYNNIQSIRLIEINFPNFINNFSKNLNNNILYLDNSAITIPNGSYNYDDLAKFITNNNNNISVTYLEDRKRFIFYSDQSFNINYILNDFNCNKITPTNNSKQNNNSLSKNYKDVYNLSNKQSLIINNGFLYEIGFDLTVDLNKSIENIASKNINNFLEITSTSSLKDLSNQYYIITNSCPRFRNFQPIYMEIDALNINYDELNPFSIGSNNMFSNLSNSSTKSAFLKIPQFMYNNGGIMYDDSTSLAFFEAPIKRIQNLKFKFRYHDNMLVDLDNQDINFTLEINELRNNIHSDINIQTPA